jgi:hypothetical protein
MVVSVIPVDVFVFSSTLNILFSISLFHIGGISLLAIREVIIIIIIIYSIFIAHFSIKTNVQRRSHSRLIQGN